jgi:hypothetical protein
MIVTKNGKLKAKFLPAMYFDSSVLIDYWMTEGLEVDGPEGPFGKILDESEAEHLHIMRQILRSEARIEKVIEIRRKISYASTIKILHCIFQSGRSMTSLR